MIIKVIFHCFYYYVVCNLSWCSAYCTKLQSVNLLELQQSQSDITTAVTPKSALIHLWVAPIHLSAL